MGSDVLLPSMGMMSRFQPTRRLWIFRWNVVSCFASMCDSSQNRADRQGEIHKITIFNEKKSHEITIYEVPVFHEIAIFICSHALLSSPGRTWRTWWVSSRECAARC